MKNLKSGPGLTRPKTKSLVALSALLALVMPQAARADITNDAKATGSYGASTITSNTGSAAVTVTPANASLQVVKAITAGPTTANGTNTSAVDGGDTVSFSYTITNNGNVTITGVAPVDAGPVFNTVAGAGTMSSFTLSAGSATLAPGASNVYTAVYTINMADAQRAADVTNGLTNVATATGTKPGGGSYTSPNSNLVQTTFTGFSQLQIAKAASTPPGGTADVGETITYTYTISNVGTRPLTNVQVGDSHEQVSYSPNIPVGVTGIHNETVTVVGPNGAAASDVGVDNGIILTLAAGATATMTYAHTVGQTEFDNQ